MTQPPVTAPAPHPAAGTPRRLARRQLSPRARRIALTAHVVTSVGWLGGAYTMLVLGLGGALSTDAAFRLACYEVMHLFDEAVNIPLALAMLVTGLLSSLGTRWGLVRHRWVLTKFLISSTVLVVTPRLSVPRVHTMIERLHANVDPGALPTEIITVSIAAVLTLTTVTAISIHKPWGRTRWGRTADRGHRRAGQRRNAGALGASIGAITFARLVRGSSLGNGSPRAARSFPRRCAGYPPRCKASPPPTPTR